MKKIKALAIIALAAVIGFAMASCPTDVNVGGGDTVISIAAITGVAVPEQGASPVTAIAANAQYTGTVAWNGAPAAFGYATVYTATITLTPKSGYTLQGVPANFFTVAGAAAVNAANSGVITAVFPQTADDPALLHLSGDITISPNTGVTVGMPLTAAYSGGETVSYQWKKDGADVGTDSDTYTPDETGNYTVTVSTAGYNPKTSDPVMVGPYVAPDVVVLNVSKETDWDYLLVTKEGSSMFFNVDETTGMPTQLWLNPDKDSDNGITYVFKENGLLDIMVNNGLIYVFDNFDGYRFDFAIIYPDDTIEYHFGIETDVDWDAFNPQSASGSFVFNGGRSVYGRAADDSFVLETVKMCLEVVGHGLGVLSCYTAFTNPLSASGCLFYLGSSIAKNVVYVLDEGFGVFDDWEAGASNLTIDGINLVKDSIGCAGKDVLDCISVVAGLGSMLLGDDLQAIIDKVTQIYEAEEELKPLPATVYFHPSGGSGTVPDMIRVQEHTTIALPSADGLSRTNHTFIGWGIVPDSLYIYSPGEEKLITHNTTYYAQWNRLVPEVPTGLTATAETADSITLSWDPVSGAIGYYLYREGAAFDSFTRLKTVLAPSTSYTDTGLSENKGYSYKVSSFNNVGESELSSRFGAKTGYDGSIAHGMVYVQGGTFQLGKHLGTVTGSSYTDVTPVSNVTISGFYISKYEVTQAQWYAVMGATLEDQKALANNTSSNFYGRGDNFPVYWVSWYDALVFCNKLSIAEGLTPAYRISNSTNPDDWGTVPSIPNATWNAVEVVSGSTGYRLPTEAQWEYAAKGGNPLADGWVGYTYAGSDTVEYVAWYSPFASSPTREVGTKAPNGLGLYDMSGNVSEWCWDWNGDYTSEDKTDPTGPAPPPLPQSSRRCRGGNFWNDEGFQLRTTYRTSSQIERREFTTGLRLVRPAQ